MSSALTLYFCAIPFKLSPALTVTVVSAFAVTVPIAIAPATPNDDARIFFVVDFIISFIPLYIKYHYFIIKLLTK
ncbi:hypothetical protein [Limosilactobacillus reuteri]|uniref:hypothetical protein n=1 Tax=Limosilactobacillus reuteri TaxID=1598 RepID=UPI003AB92FC6